MATTMKNSKINQCAPPNSDLTSSLPMEVGEVASTVAEAQSVIGTTPTLKSSAMTLQVYK